MQSVGTPEKRSLGKLARRIGGAHEVDLFGPRGRLARRGEPDTTARTALLALAGIVFVGVVLRLAVPRGIWLDEAISVHQARLSLHGLFHTLYYSDRQPPFYILVLWATIKAFGHSEFAIRLPSLVAGTLVIPAVFELARELYDRRTGLVAAAFAAVCPLLIWYSQEVRMYMFGVLFGLLALLFQLRTIRNPSFGNWACYILATAALLWSVYFGVLMIVIQQIVFAGVLLQRRGTGRDLRPLAMGFLYSLAILVMQLIPFFVFAHHQWATTAAAAGSPPGTYDYLSFASVLENMAAALWGYQPDAVTVLLASMWPLFLLLSLVLLGRGGSRRTTVLGAAAGGLVVLLIVVSLFDRSLFEVRNFLILVPLLLILIARLVTGWVRAPRTRMIIAGVVGLTLVIGLADQQLNQANPRLFDFRGAIDDIKADAGPDALVLVEPSDMRYVLEYYAPGLRSRPLTARISARQEGSPIFVLASFQKNKTFVKRTNVAVGKLTFFRTLERQFTTAQTRVWEFG